VYCNIESENLTPIHNAVYRENIEAFKALLEFNPDVSRLEMKAKVSKDGNFPSVTDYIENLSENKRGLFQKAYQDYISKETNWQTSCEEILQSYITMVNQVLMMPTENKKEMKALDDMEKSLRELSLSSDFVSEFRSLRAKLQNARKVDKALAVFESCIASVISEMDRLKSTKDFQSPEEMASLEKRLREMTPKLEKVDDGDILPDDCPVCYGIPDMGREISMCVKCCGKCCTLCFNSVATCPLCRASLQEYKPVRNRDTERMVAYYWKNKK